MATESQAAARESYGWRGRAATAGMVARLRCEHGVAGRGGVMWRGHDGATARLGHGSVATWASGGEVGAVAGCGLRPRRDAVI